MSACGGRETEALVERLSQPEQGSSPIAFPSAFPQPLWRQYVIILTKNIISYWRCAACETRGPATISVHHCSVTVEHLRPNVLRQRQAPHTRSFRWQPQQFSSALLTGPRSHEHHDCRYPQYNAVRFTFTVLFGLLLATTFWRVGMHRRAQLSCHYVHAAIFLSLCARCFSLQHQGPS